MSTDTITTHPTAAANERAQKVFSAVADGLRTQTMLMERLGLPKTTLVNTLAWLINEGRVQRQEGSEGSRRQVYYYPATDQAHSLRDQEPRPERRLADPSGFDRITECPHPAVAAAIAKKQGRVIPAQAQGGTASAPEMPAAARSPRLSKGMQEAMILAHLADHPRDSFGPYELGRALAPAGHRPLGVRDACARLAERGQILIVQNKPVRYGHRANVR